MPLQNRPPPSPADASSPPSPTLSPKHRSHSVSRPPLRTTSSDPDSGLSIPFEHLSLQEQKEFWQQHQHQDTSHWIADPRARAPQDPSVGIEQEQNREYESMFHNRICDNRSKGKGTERSPTMQHAAASRYRTPASPTSTGPQRPDLPHRTSSFSKRHASFDSPREVPLPFMPHSHHLSYSSTSNAAHTHSHSRSHSHSQANVMADGEAAHPVYGAYECDVPAGSGAGSDHAGSAGSSSSSSDSLPTASSSSSPPSGPTLSRVDTPMDTGGSVPTMTPATTASPYYMDASAATSSPQLTANGALSQQQRTTSRGPSSPVHPFSRPYSSPDTFGARQAPPRIHSPTPVRASGMPDRSSTTSLPLPYHTPYHTLPVANGTISENRDASSSRPSLPQQQSSSAVMTTTSSQPISVPSYFAGPSRYRSPSADQEWPEDRPTSPPISLLLDRAYSVTGLTAYAGFSSEPSPDSTVLPPPAPPVVLTPPPPPLSEERHDQAPHEPFLAHAPAPIDSYIAVETNPREYRLLVRLPGFRRDAITLSTRKRRILHVVADSWEPNGGHFERRISFGYDADLAQVRAEFDGEFLRVIVPRRSTPIAFWGVQT